MNDHTTNEGDNLEILLFLHYGNFSTCILILYLELCHKNLRRREDTISSRLTHAERPRSSTADDDGAIVEFYRQPGYWRNG